MPKCRKGITDPIFCGNSSFASDGGVQETEGVWALLCLLIFYYLALTTGMFVASVIWKRTTAFVARQILIRSSSMKTYIMTTFPENSFPTSNNHHYPCNVQLHLSLAWSQCLCKTAGRKPCSGPPQPLFFLSGMAHKAAVKVLHIFFQCSGTQ